MPHTHKQCARVLGFFFCIWSGQVSQHLFPHHRWVLSFPWTSGWISTTPLEAFQLFVFCLLPIAAMMSWIPSEKQYLLSLFWYDKDFTTLRKWGDTSGHIFMSFLEWVLWTSARSFVTGTLFRGFPRSFLWEPSEEKSLQVAVNSPDFWNAQGFHIFLSDHTWWLPCYS